MMVSVPKGTLLITLSPAESKETAGHFEPLHNYKSVNSQITLYCTTTEVKQLTYKQKDLLVGINRLESRLEVLHKLDWVDKLDIRSPVFVTIPTITVPVQGIIRYIGALSQEVGTKFGIELLVCNYTYSYCMCISITCTISIGKKRRRNQ